MKWKAEETFLLKEYLAWVPAELHLDVKKFWPFVAVKNTREGELKAQLKQKEASVFIKVLQLREKAMRTRDEEF